MRTVSRLRHRVVDQQVKRAVKGTVSVTVRMFVVL